MRDINDIIRERNITDFENFTMFNCPCEKLTSLKGIENFINIKRLYCTNNQLTYLDLSKNINLKYIICRDNPLNIQDLYQNLINNKNIKFINFKPRQEFLSSLKYEIIKSYNIS